MTVECSVRRTTSTRLLRKGTELFVDRVPIAQFQLLLLELLVLRLSSRSFHPRYSLPSSAHYACYLCRPPPSFRRPFSRSNHRRQLNFERPGCFFVPVL